MTKQEFLNGTLFTLKAVTYKGESTYKFDEGIISKQSRSSVDNRVVLDDYECNISKLGTKTFSGFIFIMGKRVNVKYKFEDLIVYKEIVGE
jgi:hypothetical protein